MIASTFNDRPAEATLHVKGSRIVIEITHTTADGHKTTDLISLDARKLAAGIR